MKQKSIFTGLWIRFWWLFKGRLQKSIPQILQMMRDDWGRVSNFQLFTILYYIDNKATHTCTLCFRLSVSCAFVSYMSPQWIDQEGEGKCCTTTTAVGKAWIWVVLSVRWGDQKISHNSIKYLKDQIKQIVVLVLGHESISEYRKWAKSTFLSHIGWTAFVDAIS